MDEQRALLDELMGAERNLDLEKKAQKKFWEDDICKFYLIGCSPYHVLRETRGYQLNGVDAWVRHAYATTLGKGTADTIDLDAIKCDVNLKTQYEALPAEEREKFGYERLLFDCITSLVRAVDKRVKAHQEKVALKKEKDVPEEAIAKLAELDAAIKAKIQESEELGETGEIEESMRRVAEADRLRLQKQTYETVAVKSFPGDQHRFVVCQTTGNLIESAAAADDAWMAAHFESADFQGWKLLREWEAKLAAMREGRGPPHGIPGYRGEGEPLAPQQQPRGRSPDRLNRRRQGDDDGAQARKASSASRDRRRSPSRDRSSKRRDRRREPSRDRSRRRGYDDRSGSEDDRRRRRRDRSSRERYRDRDRPHGRRRKRSRSRSPGEA